VEGAARTTNALERINEEFRRPHQDAGAVGPPEDAVLLLLFGLLRSGAHHAPTTRRLARDPSSVPIASKADVASSEEKQRQLNRAGMMPFTNIVSTT